MQHVSIDVSSVLTCLIPFAQSVLLLAVLRSLLSKLLRTLFYSLLRSFLCFTALSSGLFWPGIAAYEVHQVAKPLQAACLMFLWCGKKR